MLRILFEFIANEKRSLLEIVSSFLLMPVWFLVTCVLYVLESMQLGYSSCSIFWCVFVCLFFLRVDNNEGSSSDTQPIFAMSNDEDNKDDVKIPAVLLFSEEGRILKNAMAALDDTDNRLTVRLATKASGKSGLSALVSYFH